ncbi:MAG: hypothetical protein PHI12_11295 [Dehalococcoidales bacterium]|nr:hypothetical protein [Dehalococcoidales bacterium]
MTLTGVGTVWDTSTATNLSLDLSGCRIVISDATAAVKTFSGGGLTYHDIWLSGAGEFDFVGSNTFNNFVCNTAGATLGFTNGTTTTVRAFLVSGTSVSDITMTGLAGGDYTIALAGGGTTSSDYLSIDHCTGSPAATFYVGSHSTDNGSNHDLSFTDNATPPRATLDRYGLSYLDGTKQFSRN